MTDDVIKEKYQQKLHQPGNMISVADMIPWTRRDTAEASLTKENASIIRRLAFDLPKVANALRDPPPSADWIPATDHPFMPHLKHVRWVFQRLRRANPQPNVNGGWIRAWIIEDITNTDIWGREYVIAPRIQISNDTRILLEALGIIVYIGRRSSIFAVRTDENGRLLKHLSMSVLRSLLLR